MSLFTDAGVITPYTVRVRTSLLARGTTAVVLAFFVAAVAILAVHGAYNMTMFTYWSLTVALGYYSVLLLALFVQHRLLSVALMFLTPFALANAIFVVLAIIIILANSAEALRHGSELDTPPGKITLEQLHTGDWIIHGGPVAGMALVLLAGVFAYTRDLIHRQMHAWSWLMHYAYALFWYGADLAFIFAYMLSHDIDKKYPTSYSVGARTAIMLGISLGWNLYAWFLFTQKEDLPRLHADELPDVRDVVQYPHDRDPVREAVIGRMRA